MNQDYNPHLDEISVMVNVIKYCRITMLATPVCTSTMKMLLDITIYVVVIIELAGRRFLLNMSYSNDKIKR